MRSQYPVFLVLGCLILMAASLSAQAPANVWSSGGQHPVDLAPDAKCTDCHSELTQGKYVHTAMSMGCTTCHSVTHKGGATYVELMSPVQQLCEMCHPLASAKVLHGPYKQGECVACHSPHSSNFPQHTWAAHQDLCLGCHTHQRLKVEAKTHIARVPWGVTLSPDQLTDLPFLALNKNLTKGHPIPNHPVSGPNKPMGKDAPPIGCLSCHSPHSSGFPFLYTLPAKLDTYPCPNCLICMKCHRPASLAN